MKYRPAPEVAEIAQDLIDTVEDHEELDGFRIVYVFMDKAPKSHGRVVLGRVRKVTGLSAYLARPKSHETDEFAKPKSFGVMEISGDYWEGLKPKQQIALVDHELSHFYVHTSDNEDPELRTRGHDLEEFLSVLKRNGLWKSDVAAFAQEAHVQLSLGLVAAGAEEFLRASTGGEL